MTEFKPTPNEMICNNANKCKEVYCDHKTEHKHNNYCECGCDFSKGILGAKCRTIKPNGAELISDERRRQIEVEGWKPERDDEVHKDGGLALAGLCYLADYYGHLDESGHKDNLEFYREFAENAWLWDFKWWKPTPKDPIRQLVKAGALWE